MNVEIHDILEQIARAQSAWDQYNIQSRLPTDPRSLVQGHLWDAFNNGQRADQARRDPAATSAAWNALEHALLELTNTANRLCGRAHSRSGRLTPILPNDRRVGAFSPASLTDPRGQRTVSRSPLETSTPALAAMAPAGAEPSMEEPAESILAVLAG
jgi:hypothetical protein